MGKPSEQLANVGDLVDLDVFPNVDTRSLPGLVLALDDGWARVEWYDDSPHAEKFGEDRWAQWHPRPKLTVISRA
jgi:hypothetical protein